MQPTLVDHLDVSTEDMTVGGEYRAADARRHAVAVVVAEIPGNLEPAGFGAAGWKP